MAVSMLGRMKCGRCDTIKPLWEFYVNRSPGPKHMGSHHPGCKQCRREAAKQYAKTNYVQKGKA